MIVCKQRSVNCVIDPSPKWRPKMLMLMLMLMLMPSRHISISTSIKVLSKAAAQVHCTRPTTTTNKIPA